MAGTLYTRDQIMRFAASWTAGDVAYCIPSRRKGDERLIPIPIALRDTGHTHARITYYGGRYTNSGGLYLLEFVNR